MINMNEHNHKTKLDHIMDYVGYILIVGIIYMVFDVIRTTITIMNS